MTLFTEAPIKVEDVQLPTGAYSLFLDPETEAWKLILNKNVASGSKHDPGADLGSVVMESGELPNPSPELSMVLGHVKPKQCNLRIYYGKSGMWAEFQEQ